MIKLSFKNHLYFLFGILLVIGFAACSNDEEPFLEDDECIVVVDGGIEITVLDRNPRFVDGGELGLARKVSLLVIYPDEAQLNGIEGTAILQYEITRFGAVEHVQVMQDPGGGIGAESKRAFELAVEGLPFFLRYCMEIRFG